MIQFFSTVSHTRVKPICSRRSIPDDALYSPPARLPQHSPLLTRRCSPAPPPVRHCSSPRRGPAPPPRAALLFPRCIPSSSASTPTPSAVLSSSPRLTLLLLASLSRPTSVRRFSARSPARLLLRPMILLQTTHLTVPCGSLDRRGLKLDKWQFFCVDHPSAIPRRSLSFDPTDGRHASLWQPTSVRCFFAHGPARLLLRPAILLRPACLMVPCGSLDQQGLKLDKWQFFCVDHPFVIPRRSLSFDRQSLCEFLCWRGAASVLCVSQIKKGE
jgi:hypothetical protein